MPTAIHQRPQHGVHSGLVALSLRFQPVENVGIQADIDTFFGLRHMELGAPPEAFIGFRDVRIVDVLTGSPQFPGAVLSRYS